MSQPYQCPFCGRGMPLCWHLGIFWIQHPNGKKTQHQLDADGVEITEE